MYQPIKMHLSRVRTELCQLVYRKGNINTRQMNQCANCTPVMQVVTSHQLLNLRIILGGIVLCERHVRWQRSSVNLRAAGYRSIV